MHKKLIALAVVAAFSSPAFADTSLYGSLDAAIANISASGQKSDLLAVSGGLSPSRFGVKAVEDLDYGLKGVVVLEYGLDNQLNQTVGTSATAAGGLNARQQMLAVAGGFGTVATGYLQTTGYDWGVKFDPTAESAVSPLGNIQGGRFLVGAGGVANRAPRALAYISPNFAGVTIAVNYTTSFDRTLGDLTYPSTQTTGLKTTATLLSAMYDRGPLSVGGVYASTSNASTAAINRTDVALGGSYDLSVVKLMGTYQTTKTNATGTAGNTNKAMSFSAVAPIGPGALAFSYAKATINTGAVGTNNNGSGYTVAWLQGLSKSTTGYVALNKMSNGSGTNAFSVLGNALSTATLTNGGNSTLLAAGISKKF